MRIRSAAVLGAGVMGAQIAAHFANADLPVVLLDLTSDLAREGLARARKVKPDVFYTADAATLIRTGSFDDDLASIRSADWVVEAVLEQIDVKRALLARVDAQRASDGIVSTNTSGIPIATIGEGRSEGFRRHWLGTHFFNPPRYLRLLELIPTAETDAEVVQTIARFADVRLGKGIVIAKDTPNFIGNRIALFGVARLLRAVEAGDVTIEEVDAITGPAIGRPKSATFRTLDIAGLDVLAQVARYLAERLEDPAERETFTLPGFVERMVARGQVGAKAGRGFYEKRGEEILTLDPQTLEYRPSQAVRFSSLDAARSIEPVSERIRVLVNGHDKVGEVLRSTLLPTLEYAARIAPDVAYSPDDVDKAMRWGFGWELGPLETLRALNKMGTTAIFEERRLPPFLKNGDSRPLRLTDAPVVRKNPGASLVDLGDGVLGVEFHSKMNAIGGDTIQMLRDGVNEASRNFAALVVGTEAVNFSAGANLMLLLLEAQEGNWEDIDSMVREFQSATMALKYAGVPVVIAPAGLALGGGCEIILHGAHVQAHAETYTGLVEVGVGLIPAGGGTKEMLARAMDDLPSGSDPFPHVQRVFETIGFTAVSTSAVDARRIGYLSDQDGITMNRDRLISDAKAVALQLAAEGYRPARPRQTIRVGGERILAALKLGVHLAWRAGRISDHDALIGRKLAWILAGGNQHSPGTMTEQQILDLEREAFLSLCGERRTLERIAHALKTGKPLRN